jgi:hypothetical protein
VRGVQVRLGGSGMDVELDRPLVAPSAAATP